jgi:hypothetical protein
MEAAHPTDFKHTTLTVYPETWIKTGDGEGHWSPKKVGITLLDEEPGFTGIYIRDEAGGLYPARTVNHNPPEHHKSVCDAWLSDAGIHEDRRSVKP